MAILKFSKINKKYKPYKGYHPWLEENSYPNFCAYSWLIDSGTLTIDHYKPIEHYPELAVEPDNLMPCTHQCNSKKGDYYPKAENRQSYKDECFYIFNYREEDIGKYVDVKKDGTLTYKKTHYKNRFYFNEKIFNLNIPTFKDCRKEYLDKLDLLKRAYERCKVARKNNDQEYLEELEKWLDKFKQMCSRRLIFYKLLNIKIPKKIEKLLTNQTKVTFV